MTLGVVDNSRGAISSPSRILEHGEGGGLHPVTLLADHPIAAGSAAMVAPVCTWSTISARGYCATRLNANTGSECGAPAKQRVQSRYNQRGH